MNTFLNEIENIIYEFPFIAPFGDIGLYFLLRMKRENKISALMLYLCCP
jgi:hypothetical protein